MKVDESKSRYAESESAAADFTKTELRHLRVLLRRIQFLEAKVEESDKAVGGVVYAEREMAALQFALVDNGYLILKSS